MRQGRPPVQFFCWRYVRFLLAYCGMGLLQRMEAVAARLQSLLDRQDAGQPLSAEGRREAEGLVNLAKLLTLLRLRTQRLTP